MHQSLRVKARVDGIRNPRACNTALRPEGLSLLTDMEKLGTKGEYSHVPSLDEQYAEVNEAPCENTTSVYGRQDQKGWQGLLEVLKVVRSAGDLKRKDNDTFRGCMQGKNKCFPAVDYHAQS